MVVQFPINDVCDSKCQMCNIWQQKMDQQLSVTQARTLFSNPLFSNVVSLGLNGGEPTLRRDLAELGSMLFDTLPRLKRVSLITNGLNAKRAIERIGDLAASIEARGGQLDVMVSLDGVGDIHDRVRGVPGNFESAVRVLDFVQSLPNVTTRVGCTVITENVYHLHELLDFCRTKDVYIKFRLGVPNRRLYNLPQLLPRQIGKRTWIDTHPFGMDQAQRWHFAQFLLGLNRNYERSLTQIQFYRSLVAQLVANAPRRAGCDWQHRGVTVSSRGEILYCAVQSDVLGSGITNDPGSLYYGNTKHLRQIISEKCAKCAHDYTGIPGRRDQIELLADRWLRRAGVSFATLRSSRGYRALLQIKRAVKQRAHVARVGREVQQFDRATTATRPKSGTMLCGWYGTETIGDKAILATIVGEIRRLDPQGAIWIASLEPCYTQLTIEQMPELAGCEVIDTRAALLKVTMCRALVFAGGPLMAVPPMATMRDIFVRAKSAGVACFLAGCGVGPLGSTAANRNIRGVLAAADQRIFRDVQSRDLVSRLLGEVRVGDTVSEDPAADWVAAQELDRSQVSSVTTLGLGLRDWPSHEYARGLSGARSDTIRADFEVNLAAALEQLVLKIPALRILPIPFCTHDAGGDDRRLYWRLVRRASPMLRDAIDTSLISREPTPAEALSEMNRCRAFLAMRFHSLVFAATLGLPVVSVDYTLGAGKTFALAQKLGCPMLGIDHVDDGRLFSMLHKALSTDRAQPPTNFSFSGQFSRAWVEAGLEAANSTANT